MLLAVLQHLVDKYEHALGIASYHFHMLTDILRERTFIQNLADRTLDECERCAQLVAHIGEELYLHLIQLAEHPRTMAEQYDMYEERNNNNCYQGQKQLAPDGLPEGGVNIDVECCLVIYPYTVTVGTLHNKAVMAGRDVGQLSLMLFAYVVPVFVSTYEFICIAYEVIVLIVEGCECQSEIALVAWHVKHWHVKQRLRP